MVVEAGLIGRLTVDCLLACTRAEDLPDGPESSSHGLGVGVGPEVGIAVLLDLAHHLDPRFDALIDDSRVWGPCRAIIGCEELSLFSDKLNLKRPGWFALAGQSG